MLKNVSFVVAHINRVSAAIVTVIFFCHFNVDIPTTVIKLSFRFVFVLYDLKRLYNSVTVKEIFFYVVNLIFFLVFCYFVVLLRWGQPKYNNFLP